MSNQEAIALLRNLEDSLDSYCELNEEGKTAFRMAIEALEQAKTNCSEFPNNWIPCSERLPKESRKYLVTVFDGIGKRTTTAPYHRRSNSWTLTGRMAYWKVIAWMPLPEPYKGEQE